MNDIRFKLWWILKSPWAKKIGKLNSLIASIKASRSARLKSNEICICLSAYKRLEMLENYFIPGFNKVENKDKINVIVSCGIDEKEKVQMLFSKHAISGQVIPLEQVFSRSKYINAALTQCTSEAVFITDVDVILPVNFYSLFFKNVRKLQAWYPICDMLDENNKKTRQYPEGVGLVGMPFKPGYLLNENIREWGNEDWDFLYALLKHDLYPKRTQNDIFKHVYHRPVEKKQYKKSW